MLEEGQTAPNFTASGTERPITLSDFRGQPVVLYFYPRDNTPGCTTEAIDFRDHLSEFEQYGAIILGVSRDGLGSHQKFKTKLQLPFELLSDPDEKVCRLYEVIKLKNMYGKQVQGIERSTFLIDSDGIIRNIWRKVRVPGHIEAILAALQEINH